MGEYTDFDRLCDAWAEMAPTAFVCVAPSKVTLNGAPFRWRVWVESSGAWFLGRRVEGDGKSGRSATLVDVLAPTRAEAFAFAWEKTLSEMQKQFDAGEDLISESRRFQDRLRSILKAGKVAP